MFGVRRPPRPDMSAAAADVLSIRERISLTCPFLQRRIMQAARTASCTHPAAFCASAAKELRLPGVLPSLFRCPICGVEATDITIDADLTLVLSTYPDATTCSVRRDGDLWHYGKPHRAAASRPKRSRPSSSSSGKSARPTKTWPTVARPTTASGGGPIVDTRRSSKPTTDGRAAERQAAAARARQQQMEQLRGVLIKRALREDGSGYEDALWGA